MKKKTMILLSCLALVLFAVLGYGIRQASGSENKELQVILPEASGKKVEKNDLMMIDYSNAEKGYVMVQYAKETESKLKAQIKCPEDITYTYTITPKEWAAFPLTEGDGEYKVTVFQNVAGKSYATVGSVTVQVELEDEMLPFLTANQYVNYTEDTKCVQESVKLCEDLESELEKVNAIYEWTIKKFSYNTMKAKTVESGYVPDLDAVFKSRKAICFDYASTMVAMLRSQGVPTKLIIGYSGSVYHAWISVYTEESGWITGVVYFNGEDWSLMDPTFADTSKSEEDFKKYIGDATNYIQKYAY